MTSVNEQADALERKILHDHSPLHVTLGRDVDIRNFVVIGRAPGDDGHRMIIHINERALDKFRYALEFRRVYGRHSIDTLIRDQSENEMFEAVHDFLEKAAA